MTILKIVFKTPVPAHTDALSTWHDNIVAKVYWDVRAEVSSFRPSWSLGNPDSWPSWPASCLRQRRPQRSPASCISTPKTECGWFSLAATPFEFQRFNGRNGQTLIVQGMFRSTSSQDHGLEMQSPVFLMDRKQPNHQITGWLPFASAHIMRQPPWQLCLLTIPALIWQSLTTSQLKDSFVNNPHGWRRDTDRRMGKRGICKASRRDNEKGDRERTLWPTEALSVSKGAAQWPCASVLCFPGTEEA